MFNYQGWLVAKFQEAIDELEFNINFKLSEEQEFISDKNKEPDTLYIVYKEMSGPNSFNVKSVPVQILLLSEENSLEQAKMIASKFASNNNFLTTRDTDVIVKHSYNTPAVLSNFNQIDVGVRSILYISGSLQIISGLLLLRSKHNNSGTITVYNDSWDEDVEIKYLAFNDTYSMNTNTVQNPENELSMSKKSTSTVGISIVIPCYNNNFTRDLVRITTGDLQGNTTFKISYYLNDILVERNVKIISVVFDDNPENAPSLKIGAML